MIIILETLAIDDQYIRDHMYLVGRDQVARDIAGAVSYERDFHPRSADWLAELICARNKNMKILSRFDV